MATLQEFKAELFRTLASPTRIRILELLRSAGTLTVGEIQQRLGIEQSNVSQHLSVLKAHGLVVSRREATNIFYATPEPLVFELLDVARTIFERQLTAQLQLLEVD